MIAVRAEHSVLQESAQEGGAAFVKAVADAVESAIGGVLTPDMMAQLNADQITLLAYKMLREEVMEGGFVQLIYNGYGAFIFRNPFSKAVGEWGIDALARLVRKAHKYYDKYHREIETELSDEDFMALYEKYPDFDALDEAFVENEEMFTAQIAYYIDGNLNNFVEVTGLSPDKEKNEQGGD